jgi:hypothetical protein
MSNSTHQNKIQSPEDKLEELRKDFIKIIPQLQDIQEVQKTYREVQEKKAEEQFPFINIQTSSTI